MRTYYHYCHESCPSFFGGGSQILGAHTLFRKTNNNKIKGLHSTRHYHRRLSLGNRHLCRPLHHTLGSWEFKCSSGQATSLVVCETKACSTEGAATRCPSALLFVFFADVASVLPGRSLCPLVGWLHRDILRGVPICVSNPFEGKSTVHFRQHLARPNFQIQTDRTSHVTHC